MPKYTFEVVLKAHAKEFSDAFKKAIHDVDGLEKRIKNMSSNTSNSMGGLSRDVSGIFTIEKLRLAIDFFQAIAGMVSQVTQGILGLGKSIIDANSEWETHTISLGTTLALMNDIRDKNGEIVKGQDAFNYSLEMARDIQEQLSLMAMKYVGESKDYIGAFSSLYTLVAGSSDKLDADKIKQRTMELSQVAVVLSKVKPEAFAGGIDQIKREIGFLLRGKIEARNPLITQLGLSPALLKQWHEAGTLIENLVKQTEVFRDANDASSGTWAGLLATLADLWTRFERVLATDAFKSAEAALKKFVDLLIVGEGAALRLSPVFQQVVDILHNVFQNSGNTFTAFLDKLAAYAATHGPTFIRLGRLFDAILVVVIQNLMDLLDYLAAHDNQVQGFLATLENIVYTMGRLGDSLGPIFGWLERLLGILNEIAKTVAVVAASGLGTILGLGEDFMNNAGKAEPPTAENLAARNKAITDKGQGFADAVSKLWGGLTGDKNAGLRNLSDAGVLERGQRGGAGMKSIFDLPNQQKKDYSGYTATPQAGKFLEDATDKLNRMTIAQAAETFRKMEKKFGAFPEISGEQFRTTSKGKQEVTFNIQVGSEKETVTADMTPEEFAKFKKAAEKLEAERMKKNRSSSHKEFSTPKPFRNY